MKFINWIAWLLMGLTMSCQQDVDRVKPELTTLTESVYASVSVKPEDMYYAYSAVGGIVKLKLVTEGDKVTIGQVLVQIDNTNPELNAENARLAYELARENYHGDRTMLDELEGLINTAQLKLKHDSINYIRQKSLHEKNIGSQNEYDTRKLAYEIAQNELANLKSKYLQTKNQLETQLKQAENTYKTSLNTNKDFAVKSELEGTVYELLKEPGELVSLQEPVAMLGSSDAFLLEMLVDEVDIARIDTGQTVLVRLDAYGDQVFHGRLVRIYPKMDKRSQTFQVEAVFEERPERLYPGLTGEANIITDQKENALTIPFDYLMDGSKVKTKEGVVEVGIGSRNFERVEITAGLDTNTYIYKPDQ